MKNQADALIVSQSIFQILGYLCRERHKLALSAEQKLHSQLSVRDSSNKKRSQNGGLLCQKK